MAERGDCERISWDDLKKARRLQELFHGRFSEKDAVILYKHCNKNLQEAINFVFKGESIQIRSILGGGESRIGDARRINNISEVLRDEIPVQLRQFSCERCDNMWWRRVPSRKMVSRCKKCRQRYKAIPREDEYGWAKHICNCGNEFHGFGAMNRTQSPCYDCGNLCMPVEVVPPFQRRHTRTRSVHSCTASNGYNRAPAADRNASVVNLCMHPLSMGRKVLTPSQIHVSTGSTVNTFLPQDDLQSFCQYEPSLASITESTNGNNISD